MISASCTVRAEPLAGCWLAGCHRQNTRRCAFIVLLQPGTTDAVFRELCRECTGAAWLSLLLTCTQCAANAAVSEPANRLPWLHFASPVYCRDDMARAQNRRPGCAQSPVPGPRLLPFPTHLPCGPVACQARYPWAQEPAGFVFTPQQLCQCATESRCDWLDLMAEGRGYP